MVQGDWLAATPADDADGSCPAAAVAAANRSLYSRSSDTDSIGMSAHLWPRWRSRPADIASEHRAAVMWVSRRPRNASPNSTVLGEISVFQFPSVDVVDDYVPGSSGSTTWIRKGCLPGTAPRLGAAPAIGACSLDPEDSPIGLWTAAVEIVGGELELGPWTVEEPVDDAATGGAHQPSAASAPHPSARNDPLVWMPSFRLWKKKDWRRGEEEEEEAGAVAARPMIYGGFGCKEVAALSGSLGQRAASLSPCAPAGLSDMWAFADDGQWWEVDKANVEIDIDMLVDPPGANLELDTVWALLSELQGVATWTASIPSRQTSDGEVSHAPRQCLMVFGATHTVVVPFRRQTSICCSCCCCCSATTAAAV